MKSRKMRLALLGLTLLVGLLGVSVVQAHDGPPPGGTEYHVDVDALPPTLGDALSTGWLVVSPCVPGMGIHVIKLAGGEPTLMYASSGDLIGIEFGTRDYWYPNEASKKGYLKAKYGIDLDDPATWPVSVPPWNGPMAPHGPPDTTVHWDVHVYFDGAVAATACLP